MASDALVNLLISLENHLHPVASLFNIIILHNGAFFFCFFYVTSTFADLIQFLRLFWVFFFAQFQILHIPAPNESSCLASRITLELNDIKVGGCVHNSWQHIWAPQYDRWQQVTLGDTQWCVLFCHRRGKNAIKPKELKSRSWIIWY